MDLETLVLGVVLHVLGFPSRKTMVSQEDTGLVTREGWVQALHCSVQ